MHPWLQQRSFFNFHRNLGIHMTQYSPFGNSNPVYKKGQEMPKLLNDPTLVKIVEKYGKTTAQVALAWGIAHGRSVIPKSKTKERIKANLEGDFKLDEKISGQSIIWTSGSDLMIRAKALDGSFIATWMGNRTALKNF